MVCCVHVHIHLHIGVHALCVQEKRISCKEALSFAYIDEARLRYHSCMCTCCRPAANGTRAYTECFEPVADAPLSPGFEEGLTNQAQTKRTLPVHITSTQLCTLCMMLHCSVLFICIACSETVGLHQQVHPEEQGAAVPEPELGGLQELHHVRCPALPLLYSPLLPLTLMTRRSMTLIR